MSGVGRVCAVMSGFRLENGQKGTKVDKMVATAIKALNEYKTALMVMEPNRVRQNRTFWTNHPDHRMRDMSLMVDKIMTERSISQ